MGTAVAKKGKSQLPANFDQTIADLAKKYSASAAAASTGGGKFLSTKSGILSYNGQPIKGNKLDVVVLDAMSVNAYYKGRFDADSPSGPVCYAFADPDREAVKEMAPFDDVPEKQNDACNGCWANEWASADEGRGKACKNSLRLALMLADAVFEGDLAGIGKAEIVYLMVPVTSVAGWSQYAQKLAAGFRSPPFGIITTIEVVPDPKTQLKVTFNPHESGLIRKREVLGAIYARHEEAVKSINFKYPEPDADAGKGKGSRSAASGGRRPVPPKKGAPKFRR